MGKRLSRIYTRTGDDGTTGLGDGSRIGKTDLRVQVMGDVDELNSHVGLLRAQLQMAGVALLDNQLSRIQHELFNLGGELSIPGYQLVQADLPQWLEQDIDRMNETLPPLDNFILPAGSLAVAQCHVTRAVCRRAERQLQALREQTNQLSANALPVLNRLSDWLFVVARWINLQQGLPEVLWQQR